MLREGGPWATAELVVLSVGESPCGVGLWQGDALQACTTGVDIYVVLRNAVFKCFIWRA